VPAAVCGWSGLECLAAVDHGLAHAADAMLPPGCVQLRGRASPRAGIAGYRLVPLTVIDKVVQSGTILFSPANTSQKLTNYPKKGLYFRTAPPDNLQGQIDGDVITGDGQGDTKNHGGPDKAVLAYAAAHYAAWRTELARPDLPYGAFGENFTIADLDEERVCIGDVFEAGEALVQVSQPRQPCWKISARWRLPDLTARVEASGRTGWYLRVLREGNVAANDAVMLRERPHADWTLARATRTLRRRNDLSDAAELAALPELAAVWRQVLSRRLHEGRVA